MLNSSNTNQIPNHQLPKFQALMRLLKELKDQSKKSFLAIVVLRPELKLPMTN